MQEKLIQWYQQNKRDLPWRHYEDPYYIWISEIMLQQTTTDAVIPYFKRFINTFPTIQALASANIEEVYKLWEGLGYYRRAKHLYMSAQYIVEHHQGQFPQDYQSILALKGIGPYTAGAICSIAFHQETPAVDGNVLRIISRLYNIHDNIALPKTQKHITQIVKALLVSIDASSFNQALMDLGAMICRPQNPQCTKCPIHEYCQGYKTHQEHLLPINIKNTKHQDIHYITGIITFKDQYFLIKNEKGLLENLYGFVQYDCESPYQFIEQFQQDYHHSLTIVSHIQNIKHIFTHRTWYMHIYHFTLNEESEHLYTLDELTKLPFSQAHLKVFKAYNI